jgi:hypothetical protein
MRLWCSGEILRVTLRKRENENEGADGEIF